MSNKPERGPESQVNVVTQGISTLLRNLSQIYNTVKNLTQYILKPQQMPCVVRHPGLRSGAPKETPPTRMVLLLDLRKQKLNDKTGGPGGKEKRLGNKRLSHGDR